MSVREIKRDDITSIIELYHQLLPNDELDYKKTCNILDTIIEDKNMHIFVLEERGVIVSTATLIVVHNITHQGRPFGIIENVITLEAYRARGYGEQLLKWIIEYAKNLECHKLMVQTRRKEQFVEDFYKKCGFLNTNCKGFLLDYEEK